MFSCITKMSLWLRPLPRFKNLHEAPPSRLVPAIDGERSTRHSGSSSASHCRERHQHRIARAGAAFAQGAAIVCHHRSTSIGTDDSSRYRNDQWVRLHGRAGAAAKDRTIRNRLVVSWEWHDGAKNFTISEMSCSSVQTSLFLSAAPYC
jgi:hypothetical protein